MALTPRQQQFYAALLELCHSSGQSVHYTAVAEALSVSPFSAYDMLKVLESKGAVASEYVLEPGTSAPGRSTIMFYPRVTSTPGPIRANRSEEAEWSRVRQGLLRRLAEARDTNLPEMLSEMLNRLPDYSSPLTYCTGVIAALLVNLRASRQGVFDRRRPALRSLLSSDEVGLGTLTGLSIGSSLEQMRESSSSECLLQSARRFQIYLSALSLESRRRLAEFLHEALTALETSLA